jgi:phosphoribosylamine--glycine ligase
VRVLVIGTGGREHALVAALAADPRVNEVFVAPGNPGMAGLAKLRDVDPLDPRRVADLAEAILADLVVVGPEAPLVNGVADEVRARGIACFGPSRAAAQIEGSKAFAKDVMAAAGVPTAISYACTSAEEAAAALAEFGPPYVVKDDALAAGKGVVVTDDLEEAKAHAARCEKVVIEEFLDGPEVSLFVVTDGQTAVPLLPAQDHKRLRDHDEGPNTGGMGAYAPVPWLPPGTVDHVMSTVAEPTLVEMAKRGMPFAGLLYIGLAITSKGPKVVEFNARFGDPETEALLPLLRTGLGGLLYAAATGELAEHPELEWGRGYGVCVVIASAGYPDRSGSAESITGAEGAGYLHMGTSLTESGELVTHGGRVLCCTAIGESLHEARGAAYALVERVKIPGAQYRTDIAAPRR